ncbi:biopolymer transporter ExbD [Burkholderia gladioli pv. gladioli]|uniref:Biopolymer transport ExbD/TolR family protein n=1 Tax=Burkholderia gladioli TaxID=28095 RepID=A0A095F2J8_BURGA|nr:biopolymer transporter ExbD [Burkholderia gladioli]AJX00580.1 biopolymer transport ExbD/TolR family protein [Burkholderia gladioli]ASD79865.1 biopolymer transporter ExbD [Burkholderia gladioli pv. gladioli]AWY54892.1 biopolymer transporter ExbD [Burkholderia gladioli pv. gladioli]KGC11180.1 biopolymer transport ExbD/TolR family protein [Burkholderia gladioli]MDJ1164129.1 biopolymer transporter ExbD [Burkholderia gladioli pv. gladioli]
MRQFPQRRERKARIEIIPMIDVMMFLLAFFVLISMNVLPALGLKVSLPSSASPQKIDEQKRITLTIDNDGHLQVDGKPTEVPQLAAVLRAEAGNDKPSVIIAGDGRSNLQVLVDVLDQLKDAGLPAASIIAKAK